MGKTTKKKQYELENGVLVTKLKDDAYIGRQTQYSAGYDISSPEDITIEPHSSIVIGSGLELDMKNMGTNTTVLIKSRSSLSKKFINATGVIDYDYKKELILNLQNGSNFPYEIKKGDRVCQAIFIPIITNTINRNLPKRKGGFGSTGSGRNKEKDINKPKKPKTAYLIYHGQILKQMQSANPKQSLGNITKLIANKWKEMSDEDKKIYVDENKKQTEAYRLMMEEYNNSAKTTSDDNVDVENLDDFYLSDELVN